MRKDVGVSNADADATAELTMASASATVTHALHAGAQAPGFALPDKNGNKVTLDQLLRSGPVVINFLRGSWCSFGEESLAQFSAMHERIASAGAKAVAIAPPDSSMHQHGRLPIPELVDTDLQLARAFGLTFDLPEELRGRYLDLGYIPPVTRKSGEFFVPVPATYLIDEDGIVVFAHVDFDYRNGFGGESLLKAVRALRARREARNHDGGRPPMLKAVHKAR
jgi:peroxiredoxin